MAAFSPSQAIAYGWTNAKQNWKWWIPVLILYAFINAFPGFFAPAKGQPESDLYRVINFIFSIIQIWLVTGISINTWNMIHGKAPNFKTIFPSFGPVIRNFLASMVTAVIGGLIAIIIMLIGWMLSQSLGNMMAVIILALIAIALVVMALWLAIRLSYAPYVAIFDNKWPIEAVKRSWAITKGNISTIIWLALLSLGAVILGALALVIGLLWAFPTVMVANLYLYKQLSEARA